MPRKNDEGVVIRLTITKESDNTALDISSATTRQILIEKPSGGTALTKTATLTGDGTDGQMEYATISGDLDEAGRYEVQGRVVIGSQDFITTKQTFIVDDIIT